MRIPIYVWLVILLIGCSPKGKYISSPNNKYHLTLYEQSDEKGKSFTFITYGKVRKKKMPKSYIKARNRHSDAWYCLISWEGQKAIIYQPYSNFVGYNLDETKLELREMKEKAFSKIFFSKEKDQYIRLSSYNK